MNISKRKRTAAILVAATVVVAASVATISVSAANAAAAETARQCTAALKYGRAADVSATASVKIAGDALTLVKSVDLPGSEGWKSTSYAGRPAAAAAAGKPAQPSGADLIEAVVDGRDELSSTTRATTCTERDAAARITHSARDRIAASMTLDQQSRALNDDFTVFQSEEKTRVAAEVEAARKKAAEAAARKAAEEKAAAEEAARQEAAAEAARRDAEAPSSTGSSGGGYSSGTGGTGGGSVGGGSFGVGSGDSNGWCQKSNSVGGTTKYRC